MNRTPTMALLLWLIPACSPAPAELSPPPTCRARLPIDPAGPETVRVFAVGLRQESGNVRTYAEFTQWIENAIAAEAPCFSSSVPNLIVFPENTGLIAAFLGTRGDAAREQTESLGAFASLFTSYRDSLQYYRAQFPGAPSIRMLLLALTDPVARSMEQTFPVLAAKYNVYLAVSLNVADYAVSTDPDVVAKVGDPDLKNLTRVYVASTAEVYNYAIVYGPDGKEAGRVRKAYLVPDEESLLQLSYGSLEQLRPIVTPFGKLAPVISKDGWMPDVLERFNELDADITLQHEAFSGWAVEEHHVASEWLPDVVKESFWNHVQAYDSFRYGVMPCLTGNLFELVFDCQSTITKEAMPADEKAAFIGQTADVGFLHVGPWVMETPAGDLEQARQLLRERGNAMLPGAGAPYENDYTQSVARGGLALGTGGHGVPLRTPAGDPSFRGTELVLGGSETSNAIRPDIAYGGQAHHVVWLEDAAAKRTVQYARLVSGTSAKPAAVTLPIGGEKPYNVRVAAAGGNVYAVAVHDPADGAGSLLTFARSTDGGLSWKAQPTPFAGTGAWARWNPSLAATGNAVILAWTDRRSGSSDIHVAISHDAGATFTARRLDEDAAEEEVRENPANTRNNQALSSIAVLDDHFVVTWADFRNYKWDVFGASSTDAGATWSPNERFNRRNGTEDEIERIFGVHAAVLTSGGLVVIAEGVADRGPARQIWNVTGADSCLSDCSNEDPFSPVPAYRPHLSSAGGRTFAVWQDLRNGDNDIYGATDIGPGAACEGEFVCAPPASAPVAIAKIPGQQFNPRSAGAAVVWEDWRTGRGRIVVSGFPDLYNPNDR